MHDGIHVEKAGIPSITICTDIFEITAKSMASMWGAAEYPILYTRHPIAGLTQEQLHERAESMMNQLVRIVTS